MTVTPTEHLEPLRPIIGHWKSSGTIRDDEGEAVGSISGTDTYSWLPNGNWILHQVDVTMNDQHTQVLELIGGRDAKSGGWQMHAFDTADDPGTMRLTLEEPGLLLLKGDGVRSWFRPEAGRDRMTALWEREVGGQWLSWMDMHFERV